MEYLTDGAVLKRLIFSSLFSFGLFVGRLLVELSYLDFTVGEYKWDLSRVDMALYALAGISLLYSIEPFLWRTLLKSEEEKLQKTFFWHALPVFFWVLIGIIWQWDTKLLASIAWGIWFFARLSSAMRFSGIKESILARTGNLPRLIFIFTVIPLLWAGFSFSPILLTSSLIVFFAAIFIFCRDHFRAMTFECSLASAPLVLVSFSQNYMDWHDAVLMFSLLFFIGVLFISTGLRKKQIRAYAPVMWAVVILALAGAETTLRQTKYGEHFVPNKLGEGMESDEVLFFVPEGFRPGVGGFDVRKFAFRSGEVTRQKPPGVFRIICVGGSSTYGKGVEDTQAWPFLLERKLVENDIEAQVINAGLPGYSSFQIMILLREYLLSYDPDVVLMYAGFNDMALSTGPYTMRELWSMMRGQASTSNNIIMRVQELLSHSIVYNAMRSVIVGTRKHTERSGKVIVANRQEFIRNVHEIYELCSENGVRFLAMAEATQYDDDYYHTGLAELANRRNFPFKDVYADFRLTPEAVHWFSDVVHLTPNGNRVLAGMAFEFLEKSGALP